MSMIKSPLGFLDVSLEGACLDAPHLCQACFGDTPETLDAVDMRPAVGENIIGMFDSVMSIVSDIDQSVISLPLVGVNHGVVRDKPFYYRHERGGGAVFNNLREDSLPALFHSEHDGLAARAATSFALDTARAEIGFVNLNLSAGEGRFPRAHLRDSLPREGENPVDRVAVQSRQRGDLNPAQIKSEETCQQPKFCLCNSRTAHILVSHR